MQDDNRERLGRLSYESRRAAMADLHVADLKAWDGLPEWCRDVERAAAMTVHKATMEAARVQLIEAAHLYPPERPWDEALDEVDRQCIDRRELAEALKLSPLASWGEAMAEVGRLRAALDEREGDMHARIRAGYDKTVADCWRAKVAEVEAERDGLRAALADLVERVGNETKIRTGTAFAWKRANDLLALESRATVDGGKP